MNPAAAAVVVLIPKDHAAPVVVDEVIASYDLAAGGLFGLEVNLCANHWSLPRGWQESMKAAGRRLAGRADHDARAAPFGTVITQPRLVPFCTIHERIGTPPCRRAPRMITRAVCSYQPVPPLATHGDGGTDRAVAQAVGHSRDLHPVFPCALIRA